MIGNLAPALHSTDGPMIHLSPFIVDNPAAEMPLLTPKSTLVFEGGSMTRRSTGPSLDTWAFLRMNNWHHSYTEIIEEWLLANLPELQIRTRHSAVGGSTMANMFARYETQVKPCEPDWIVFTIGGNDYSREVPLAEFEGQLREYITRAANDHGTRFFYAGGFRAMPGLGEAETRKIEDCRPYFDLVRRVVRESGGLACNMGIALKEKADALYQLSSHHTFYSDGVHLNALANHVLAGLVLKHLGVCTPMQVPETLAIE